MYILAFETSCDDTSVAILQDGHRRARRTASQALPHTASGGVVPEVAARMHEDAIFRVLDEALAEAGVTLADIDEIACTETPGLLPSLLVGLSVSRTLAAVTRKPWMPVNHVIAHMFANFLDREVGEIPFPNVCLTASGGHNELYLWRTLFDCTKIGETLDDASGEAFDKVAKALGLGYPGGPEIARVASEYTGSYRGIFPIVLLSPDSADMSFSGLKSAVKREIDRRILASGGIPNTLGCTECLSDRDRSEIAFEFQEAVVRALVTKTFDAVDRHGVAGVLLAGGVSANRLLRERCQEEAVRRGIPLLHPVRGVYCQDNAAMVGMYAYMVRANPL